MAQTKLGIYNGALLLLGQRALASDTEAREPRFDLDNLYDNGGVDYCLEMVKPRYASKVIFLTGATPTAITQLTWQTDLPDADFLALVDLFADGKLEQPIEKFYREADFVLSDFENLYCRYIQDFATSGLTNMTPSFGRVVMAYFARELSVKYDPDSYDGIDKELAARVQIIADIELANEPQTMGLLPTVLTDEWRKIYNDGFLILGLDPIASNSDDSIRKNRFDLARDAELVESVLEDNAWGFGSQSDQIFYNPSIDPALGFCFVFDKPADLHRLDGIYSDEFFRNPIRDYIDEGNQFFSNLQTIYIEYTSSDFVSDPSQWKSYFKRLIAARLAVDAGGAIEGANMKNAVAQYDNRRKEAFSTDAMARPPKTLTEGRWSRTRRDLNSGRRDRPGG